MQNTRKQVCPASGCSAAGAVLSAATAKAPISVAREVFPWIRFFGTKTWECKSGLGRAGCNCSEVWFRKKVPVAKSWASCGQQCQLCPILVRNCMFVQLAIRKQHRSRPPEWLGNRPVGPCSGSRIASSVPIRGFHKTKAQGQWLVPTTSWSKAVLRRR